MIQNESSYKSDAIRGFNWPLYNFISHVYYPYSYSNIYDFLFS